MAFNFHLPDIGEGVVEGEIVSWKVAEGDRVVLSDMSQYDSFDKLRLN